METIVIDLDSWDKLPDLAETIIENLGGKL